MIYQEDEIYNICINEDGEFDEFLFTTIQAENDEKIRNLVWKMKNQLADAEAIKQEEQNLKKRREHLEKSAESIKSFLAKILDGKKIEEPTFKISWRTTKDSLVIDDSKPPESFSDEFKTVSYKVNRSKIKEALKRGESVEGCRLEEVKHIQIK